MVLKLYINIHSYKLYTPLTSFIDAWLTAENTGQHARSLDLSGIGVNCDLFYTWLVTEPATLPDLFGSEVGGAKCQQQPVAVLWDLHTQKGGQGAYLAY